MKVPRNVVSILVHTPTQSHSSFCTCDECQCSLNIRFADGTELQLGLDGTAAVELMDQGFNSEG